MRGKWRFWGWLAGCLLLVGPSDAAESTLKGQAFGDYYYYVGGINKKRNGFEIRRVYLTWDVKWDDAFSGRVRLEANDGGFGSGKKMEPFVKHAYVRYRKNSRALYLGLSGTPTFSVSESVWGYRPIEKNIMDLNRIASSSDIGLAFHGALDGAGKVNVQLMLANGSGQASEVDNDKKAMGLLHFKPGAFEATLYADWENRAGDTDRMTFAGFVGLSGEAFQGGIEGFVQVRKSAVQDVQARGLSVFGSGALREKVKAFGRIDFFDPSDQAGSDRSYLFIGGLDLAPVPDIHIMPNVLTRAFQAPGIDAEVIPRVTVYVVF